MIEIMLKTLILIPTEYEANFVRPALHSMLETGVVEIWLCGFGPIASGIRTMQLLAELRPASCFLLGIAGTYRSSLAIGSAYEFSTVSCYGVGVGSGSQHLSASKLGWRQWPGCNGESIDSDTLRLPTSTSASQQRHLLTVCAASSDDLDVDQRLRTFPKAVAEDMESFSVALACLASKVPLTILRGISNQVGDRDKSRWAVAPALEAAAQLAARYVGSHGGYFS
jgi:futalosine hydrolase